MLSTTLYLEGVSATPIYFSLYVAGIQPLVLLRSLNCRARNMRPSWKSVSETMALAMPMPWARAGGGPGGR